MKLKTYLIITLMLAVQLLALSACGEEQAGKYDEIAKCITSKGVIFYGAYWCSHCANVKKMFGSSMQYVTYVECAAGGQGADVEACKKAGIVRYPSFYFPGQELVEGEMTPEEIAEKANCLEEPASTLQTASQSANPASAQQ